MLFSETCQPHLPGQIPEWDCKPPSASVLGYSKAGEGKGKNVPALGQQSKVLVFSKYLLNQSIPVCLAPGGKCKDSACSSASAVS